MRFDLRPERAGGAWGTGEWSSLEPWSSWAEPGIGLGRGLAHTVLFRAVPTWLTQSVGSCDYRGKVTTLPHCTLEKVG